MKTLLRAWMIAVFLAVLAVASGCEDSQGTVGKDDKMYLLANPSSVQVDPNNPPTSGIVATIVSSTGVPRPGVLVFFSSTAGGQLASSTQPVPTDANGNAYDTLTVDAQGLTDISVTATATALTQTVKVTRTLGVCSGNTAPTAHIAPHAEQTLSDQETVGSTADTTLFSGLTSTDTQNQIQRYTWTCYDGATPSLGPTVVCTYTYDTVQRTYTVKLVVTDQGLTGHPECALSSTPDSVTVIVPAGM
jgi:hypothetical protein